MKFTVNELYKGFKVLKVDTLTDLNAIGYYLKHQDTGLEVYQIQNDSVENIFSISFRTVAKHSKGIAHIMEHSVLCGSEKYSSKDPFVVLNQKSLNTYLNAFTYPEKTVYPGSSLIPSEYFKMFDVYMDAVYFPLLKKETFLQEAWRLEYENDKPSIQGVVYNEMKGAYSNPDEIEYESLGYAYKDSYHNYSSGGSPSEIPNLTYEEYLDFHKKYYSPTNSIVVMVGNIPLEENLDFLDTYTDRLLKKYGKNNNNNIKEQMTSLLHTEQVKKEVMNISSSSPVNNICWYVDRDNDVFDLLNSIMFNEHSKFYSILQKEFNEDISTLTGYMSDYPIGLFTIGIKNKLNIQDKLLNLIENYYKVIPQEDIDSAIKSIEHNIRNYSSPRYLSSAIKVIDSWVVGDELNKNLNMFQKLEELKKKCSKEYLSNLIKTCFLDTKPILDITLVPSEQFTKDMERIEKEHIKRLVKETDKDKVIKEINNLHKYQESIKAENNIKPLSSKSLSIKNIPIVNYSYDKIGKIIFDTNGLTTLSFYFPIESLSIKELQQLPFLSEYCMSFGYDNLNWEKCVTEASKYVKWYTCINNMSSDTLYNTNLTNRLWFEIGFDFLESDSEKAYYYINKMLDNPTFNDTDLLLNKVNTFKTDINERIKSDESICNTLIDQSNIVDNIEDIIRGISFVNYFNNLEVKPQEMLKDMKTLFEKIKSNGCLMFVTSDEKGIKNVENNFKINLNKVSAKKPFDVKGIKKEITKLENIDTSKPVCVKLDTQAGIAVTKFKSSKGFTKEYAAERVLLEGYACMHQLWTKIRTQGGAYGAWSSCNPNTGIVTMSSYRDPSPFNSLSSFEETLQELVNYSFSEEETNDAIVSVMSSIIIAYNPNRYTYTAIKRYINNISQEDIYSNVNNILSITPSDLHNAAVRLLKAYNSSKKEGVSVPLTDTTVFNTINI